MSAHQDDVRDVAKEVLAELLPVLLEEALATSAPNGNGHRARETVDATDGDPVVPQVPAPPIAKVHRPSGWREPSPPVSAPDSPAAAALSDAGDVERVDLRSDADLAAFVHTLARRLENPRERAAIVSGQVRFQLAGVSVSSTSSVPTIRVESGAVTERAVRDAAKAGARLVLSSRAMLTPMARDRARSLGVEIEKEKRC